MSTQNPTNASEWVDRAIMLDRAHYERKALYAYRQAYQHGEQEHIGDDWLMGVSRAYFVLAERLGIEPPPIGSTKNDGAPVYDGRMENKILCIQMLRQRTGWGLKDSKDFVEAVRPIVDTASLLPGFDIDAVDIVKPRWGGTLQDYLEYVAALGRAAQAVLDAPDVDLCDWDGCDIVVPYDQRRCHRHKDAVKTRWATVTRPPPIAEYPLSDSPTGQAIGETAGYAVVTTDEDNNVLDHTTHD